MADHEQPHRKKPEDSGVLGPDCGHHCGVITTGLTDQKQAHCPCPECHSETAILREVPTEFTMSTEQINPNGIR